MNNTTIRQALEQIPLPYLITDTQFQVLWCNSCMQEQYGWLNTSEAFHALLFGYDQEELCRSLQSQKKALSLDCRLPMTSLTLTVSPIDENEFLVLFAGQSLPELRQETSLTVFNKSLRTPLMQLFGGLATMSHRLDAKHLPYLQSMTRDCYQMLRSCISIAEYGEYINGESTLKKEYQELGRWIHGQLEPAISMLQGIGITLTYTPPEKSIFTNFDSEKMAMVLFSLISNSCMFCESGGKIHVTVTTQEKNAVISISDNGRGIPAEEISHVMEPYYSNGGQNSNLGLGLPLSKSIMEQHGGSLSLQSAIDIGTTITLSLPIQQAMPSGTLALRAPIAPYDEDRFSKRTIFLSVVMPPEEYL